MKRYLPYILTPLATVALYIGVDALIGESTPPGHVYLLEGKVYRHTSQREVDEHVDALWAAYCRQQAELIRTRPKAANGQTSATWSPEDLKAILDSIKDSILKDTEDTPNGMPESKQKPYREALASCVRAKLIHDGLEFIKDIAAANPPSLGTDPTGYYDDRNGGVICVVAEGGKCRVYVGAGRGPNYNSDRLSFIGTLKDDVVIGDTIPGEPARRPKLLVHRGMASLSGVGDRLSATYVRVGMLTKMGKELAGSCPLGSEITDDAGAERYVRFMKEGVVFFRNNVPEWPNPNDEALAIVGFKPKPMSSKGEER
jgi:hypothetical protein